MVHLVNAAIALALGAVVWQVLAAVRRAVERRTGRLAPRILRVLERAALMYGAAGAAIALAPLVDISILPPKWQQALTTAVLAVVSAIVAVRLARELISGNVGKEGAATLAASFVQTIVAAIVYVLAAIIILDAVGVNITGMVAALGAGSLIIGLALQETLANFFAGLYILLTGKFKVGDYVQFDGFDGTIEDITWRTTILRRATNAVLIVPNQRMSSSVLTVFRADESPIRVRLEFLLEPSEGVEQAETIVQEALAELIASGKVEGLIDNPPPLVRYAETTSLGVAMHVWVSAHNVQAMFEVRTAAVRACVEAFRRAGIRLLVLRQ